jgi:hypothetical protein
MHRKHTRFAIDAKVRQYTRVKSTIPLIIVTQIVSKYYALLHKISTVVLFPYPYNKVVSHYRESPLITIQNVS